MSKDIQFDVSAGDNNRALELQNYVVKKIELMKRAQSNVLRVTQLASFIPDFILTDDNKKIPYHTSYEAVTFMADVSGFTSLTEAYSLRGKGGTDQLTKTLTSYLSPLAECILRAEGDIIKYAGDAFLAVWKVQDMEDYAEEVQRVIDCALYIQEKYGSYSCVDVNITIRVKIGIGAGVVHSCGIGSDTSYHYVTFGPGVRAATMAEKYCSSSEVVCHQSAWNYCTPANFVFSTKLSEEGNYYQPQDIVNYINPEKRGRNLEGAADKQKMKSLATIKSLDEKIRPSISLAVENKSEAYLRLFLIPPVLRKLDDEVPLEYLNESRNVSICFILLDTYGLGEGVVEYRENMTFIVQKAYIKISHTASKLQGCVNKVIMFDKGLTYLVVFGLPGYISENQCAHALRFSYHCKRSLKNIRFVQEVSIGVTSGSCYCGVLGNPRRHEYTVIGRKVNKAARLMCNYPGKLTCDQDTMYHSKLSLQNFELLEEKELKGIKDVGKIFEFLNDDSTEEVGITYFEYPILGRKTELTWIKTNLYMRRKKELQKHMAARKNGAIFMNPLVMNDQDISRNVWTCVMEGETGIGKSRMLAACIDEADNIGIKTFSLKLNLMESTQPHYAISTLAAMALNMSHLRTNVDKEDYLKAVIIDDELSQDLCLLNEILGTKFPTTGKYATKDVTATHTLAMHLLGAILRFLYPDELILFAIDDSHLMDVVSWEYLVHITKGIHCFGLCTLRRNNVGSPKLPESVEKILFGNKKENLKVVRLYGLEKKYCLPLAGQILQVCAIPIGLEKLLVSKSQGVPAWCHEVLIELVRQGILKIVPYPSPMINVSEMRLVDEAYLLKNTRGAQSDSKLMDVDALKISGVSRNNSSEKAMKETTDPFSRAVAVKPGTNIANVPVSGTLKEILLDSFDELNSNEQMILKCASVLGVQFSKEMLTKLLPVYDLNAIRFDHGFKHLMLGRFFRCASGKQKKDSEAPPECYCKSNQPIRGMGKFWNCKFMEFVKEHLVEVIYELLTEDQKKELHLKAAMYLDDCPLVCENCGGVDISVRFGFPRKAGDLGAARVEEAYRFSKIKTCSKPLESKSRTTTDFDCLIQGTKLSTREQRPSFVPSIEAFRKTFAANKLKVNDTIENEIIRSLKNKRSFSKLKTFFNKILRFLKLKKSETGMEPTPNNEVPFLQENDEMADDSAEKNKEPRLADLRFCECAKLQAKVAIEMIRHYRVAEKYGKCLANLLDAAESVIVIGNGSQALIHLDDAIGLLKSLKLKELPSPDPEDPNDARIDEMEVNSQIEFLSGLAYFEIGVFSKARDLFIKALARQSIFLPNPEDRWTIKFYTILAQFDYWMNQFKLGKQCIKRTSRFNLENSMFTDVILIKILSYLQLLLKKDRKPELALLVSFWRILVAETKGNSIYDILPAYASMMEIYVLLGKHNVVKSYDKLSINAIMNCFGSGKPIEAIELLSTGNLFVTMGKTRLFRGAIKDSSAICYLGLRISQTIHDNSLVVRMFPFLYYSNLFLLKIPEVVQILRKLWYVSEEEEDWLGVTAYYVACMDLLLNTAYPLESFGVCEHFMLHCDWTQGINVFGEHELQYLMEASLSLWYTRHSKWDIATRWLTYTESHRPKGQSFLIMYAELKLLECNLIFINHYLDTKRYQHFARAKNSVRSAMKFTRKMTDIIPLFKPRYYHLLAYYHRIRSCQSDAQKNIKLALKLASQNNNALEQEWINHNVKAWSNSGMPTAKQFWLNHTENQTLDWHNADEIPWSNIMYTLPLPAWK